MMSKTNFILSLLFVFNTSLIFAQKEEDKEIESVEIELTGPGERTIKEAFKISESPKIVDSIIPIPTIKYEFIPKYISTDFDVKIIAPAKLKVVEPLEKLYRIYLKGGVGLYTTPLFELTANSLRSRKSSYAFFAKHFSSKGGIKEVGFSGFSENALQLKGKTFLRHHSLEGNLDFNQNVIHKYGFNTSDTTFKKEDIRQRYNSIGGMVRLKSYYKDTSKINHNISLAYYHYADINYSIENNILLNANLNKWQNNELYSLDIGFDFNNYDYKYKGPVLLIFPSPYPVAVKINNGIFSLQPKISTQGDSWKVKVGLSLFVDATDVAKFHFYPDAEFKYSLFNNIFIPYVGITGGVKRNSYKSLSTENPFVLSGINLLNTNNKLQLYGGIRGSFSSTTSFNLKISQQTLENVALFYNDTLYSVENQFGVLFDTLKVFNISGQLSFHKTEKLKLYLRGDYYDYKTQTELFAWNKPNIKLTFSGVYDLKDKLLARADIFVIGRRKAKSLKPIEGVIAEEGIYAIELPAYLDINLGFEYRYTKRLSAFINFSNIAAQKYLKWNKYPVQGFNVIGGFTYSF